MGDASTEKGPLWKPGDGLRSFTQAERTWVMDHPTFRLLMVLIATVGTAVSDLLSRLFQGRALWVVMAMIPATVGVLLQLWLRAQLQRPCMQRPLRQPSRSWWQVTGRGPATSAGLRQQPAVLHLLSGNALIVRPWPAQLHD